jgi:hypothetical protein
MLEDSFKYYKGCQACQRFGKIQIVSTSVMNPIIKPWPFRSWGMDMIDKINPPSNKGHQYILVITDYFTKWVEAIPMKIVTSKDVINFIKEHVIHRFGIPQTIPTDGGSVFISEEFRKFAADVGIKLTRKAIANAGSGVFNLLSMVLYPMCAHFASQTLPANYWEPGQCTPMSRPITITRIVSH